MLSEQADSQQLLMVRCSIPHEVTPEKEQRERVSEAFGPLIMVEEEAPHKQVCVCTLGQGRFCS